MRYEWSKGRVTGSFVVSNVQNKTKKGTNTLFSKKYEAMVPRIRSLAKSPFTANKGNSMAAAKNLRDATPFESVIAMPAFYSVMMLQGAGVGKLVGLGVMLIPWILIAGISFAVSDTEKNYPAYFLFQRLRTYRLLKAYVCYAKIVGAEEVFSVKFLAESARKSERSVRRCLRRMVQQHFLPEGVLDEKEDMLFLTKESREAFMEARRRECMKLETVHCSEIRNFAVRIREHNDILPDKQISDALDVTEKLLNRLVKEIEKNPAQDRKLRRTAAYYLPQLESLLMTYRDLYQHKKDLKTTGAVLVRIVGGVHMLNGALKQILEEMVEETAMMVDTDLNVMEMMLAQDGLARRETQ